MSGQTAVREREKEESRIRWENVGTPIGTVGFQCVVLMWLCSIFLYKMERNRVASLPSGLFHEFMSGLAHLSRGRYPNWRYRRWKVRTFLHYFFFFCTGRGPSLHTVVVIVIISYSPWFWCIHHTLRMDENLIVGLPQADIYWHKFAGYKKCYCSSI